MLKAMRSHYAKVSASTDDMYEPHQFRKLHRLGTVMTGAASGLAAYVGASVILPPLTTLETVDFGKDSPLILIPLAFAVLGIACAVTAERNPATFRLNPCRPSPEGEDEWERDVRRRTGEIVLRKVVTGMVALLLLVGTVFIVSLSANFVVENANILSITGLYVALLAGPLGVCAAVYKAIAKTALPASEQYDGA